MLSKSKFLNEPRNGIKNLSTKFRNVYRFKGNFREAMVQVQSFEKSRKEMYT